ncbi:TPA: YjbH domain-containing protein [Escherichia coli]
MATPLCLASRCAPTLTICARLTTITPARNINRSRAAIGWTPLTRDGGQQLGRKFQLYDMTSDRSVNFR